MQANKGVDENERHAAWWREYRMCNRGAAVLCLVQAAMLSMTFETLVLRAPVSNDSLWKFKIWLYI